MRKSIVATFVIIASQLVTVAKENSAENRLSDMDRAIAFAVELELRANHLENRRDVCVGFGHGLVVDENGIISELNPRGLKVRSNEWCNHGPRGSVVSVIPPIDKSRPGTYEFVVELGDLRRIKQEGEHFGTLLRRGTYAVQCEDGNEPDLVAYRKTCCPEQPNPTR